MNYSYLKEYRKNNLGDESGWANLKDRLEDCPDLLSEKEKKEIAEYLPDSTDIRKFSVIELLNYLAEAFEKGEKSEKGKAKELIDTLFVKCRYSYVFYNKTLWRLFIRNTFNMDNENEINMLDIISNEAFLKMGVFLNSFKPEKNKGFFEYFNSTASDQIQSAIVKENKSLKAPKEFQKYFSKITQIYARNPNMINDDKAVAAELESMFIGVTAELVHKIKIYIYERDLVAIDTTLPPNGDDKCDTIQIIDLERSPEKQFEDSEKMRLYAERFSTMLNMVNIIKHYDRMSEQKKAYYKTFYTCDTLKYIKNAELQFALQMHKKEKNILDSCDDGFFMYVLSRDSFKSLKDVEFADFKTYRELESGLFSEKCLDEKIEIIEMGKDSDEAGKLKLNRENKILSAYMFKKSNDDKRKETSFEASVSMNKKSYDTYKRKILIF